MQTDDKKVISLMSAKYDKKGAYSALEDISEMLGEDRVKAFAAVVIEPRGELSIFIANVMDCSRLEMAGSLSAMAHMFHNGEDLV